MGSRKKQGLAFRDSEGDTPSILAGPVIVLTIEELKDFYIEGFEDGYDSAAYSDGTKKCNELFGNYLKSKGLTIKQQ